MRLQRTAAIVLRQVYLYRGSPARFLPLFIWVAIDIVLWGFITRFLNSVSGSGFNFVPALLGAVLLWNFLNLFATPLLLSEYLGGLVASSIATSLAGLAIMLVLATAAFGLNFFTYGVLLIDRKSVV